MKSDFSDFQITFAFQEIHTFPTEMETGTGKTFSLTVVHLMDGQHN